MTETLPRSEATAGPEGETAGGAAVAGTTAGRTLVIWNPGAGGGPDPDKRRAEIREVLARHGVDAELFESGSEAETARRVEQALADGVERIVAAGGDGTVRSIAFALLDRDAALGILPLGTAMNVARSLGIPIELDGAAAILASGTVRAVDVGECRGRPFLEIASVGFGAEVLQKATHVGEGRLSAALDLIRAGIRYQRTRVRLQLDGREVRGRALTLAIANGSFTGRALEMAPGSRLDDGRFDVILFEGFGVLGFLSHISRVLLGRSHDERVRRYRAASVRVSARRPLPVRLDSQDVGLTPASFSTRHAALRVVVPAR